jgi:hypothetical protein
MTTTHNKLFIFAKRQFLLYGSQLVNTPYYLPEKWTGKITITNKIYKKVLI